MPRIIVPIVEGYGEVDAVPILLDRQIVECGQVGGVTGEPVWRANQPINALGRGNLIVQGGIEENVRIASGFPDVCGILVVLDAEGDPFCTLGPDLQQRAELQADGIPVRVCLAVRQFENWIAAGMVHGQDWEPEPDDYEGTGAESSIKARMPGGRYKKTTHQGGLTARLDVELAAQRCPSLKRLLRCMEDLVRLA